MKARKQKQSKSSKHAASFDWSTLQSHWMFPWLHIVIGVLIAYYLGQSYASYIKQLHENDMWFSNITQVEREISFRTESGLYFNYYKNLVTAPSIRDGLHGLTHDNMTEHLRTINILERFNIYQEVVLGIMYKMMPLQWQQSIEYVYFYINAVFGLHGVYMMSLFASSWLLSGNMMAGVLSNAFYVFNRIDMTRIWFTMPLRESFSLPFIYLQVAVLTLYFKKDTKPSHSKKCLWLIAIFMLCFTLTWQFAQFVLLLQSFTFFALYVLEFVTVHKVLPLFYITLGNLATCCVLQYGNDMLYTSLVSSFCVGAILVMSVRCRENGDNSDGVLKKVLILLVRIISVLGLMLLINYFIKKVTRVDSDDHIYKFVSAKLGYGEASKTTDFDARLYLCEGSFKHLPWDTFERLTDGYVFPVYIVSGGVLFLMLLKSYLHKLTDAHKSTILDDYPELVFHLILSVFFGLMALTTLRMKFLWMPHVCILASGVFCHQEAWKTTLNKFNTISKFNFSNTTKFLLRHSVPALLLSALLMKKLPAVQEELTLLRQFHDPDTVALMQWIKSSTPLTSAFSGSMQLMAGVKLCTDRAITNHPHYENKWLRLRTKDIYQMYARRSAQQVRDILRSHGTTHIVLENSICYSQMEAGCRLTDILDVDNGHKVNDRNVPPRFCDAIKHDGMFTKYFKKVFENRTFYVYQLL